MPITAVTDSGDRRITKLCGAPPHEPEHLPCPRCDSTNTKFCYYNNYNFSQPRHFCKSCRRYWTHGGTLRDIPIGGGSRKNAKRSRTTVSSSSAAASLPAFEFRHFPSSTASAATPILIPIGGADSVCGSFTSLLNTQGAGGIFGFGVGGTIGLEDVSFGLGRAIWPFSGIGSDGGGATNNAASGGGGVISMGGINSWQTEGGDGGVFVGGDCFSFPDLAISTANGSGLK